MITPCALGRLRLRQGIITLGPSAEDGGWHSSAGGSPPDHVHHLFVYFRHDKFKCRALVSPTATQGKDSSVGANLPALSLVGRSSLWHWTQGSWVARHNPTLLAGSKLAGRTDINEATTACKMTTHTDRLKEGDCGPDNMRVINYSYYSYTI